MYEVNTRMPYFPLLPYSLKARNACISVFNSKITNSCQNISILYLLLSAQTIRSSRRNLSLAHKFIFIMNFSIPGHLLIVFLTHLYGNLTRYDEHANTRIFGQTYFIYYFYLFQLNLGVYFILLYPVIKRNCRRVSTAN